MGFFLLFILALQFVYSSALNKVSNTPLLYTDNPLNDKLQDYNQALPTEFSNDNQEFLDNEDILPDVSDMPGEDIPLVQNFEDKTELQFRKPIEAVNIDYTRNTVVLKFHRNNAKSIMKLDPIEHENKKSEQDNFMNFDKRSYEQFALGNSLGEDFSNKNKMRLERSQPTARDARGDNFMRFGRSMNEKNDFMRFGRAANDFMRFGRAGSGSGSDNFMRFGRAAGQDFMRFGRIPGKDFMRFGRTQNQNFMRFGRTPSQDFMRFGRTPSQDFMRFGRAPNQDFMRFGRAGQENFMRFGRTPHENFMRFGRNSAQIPINTNFMRYSRPDNFMRFGRTPSQASDNFMRFGKNIENSNDKNATKPLGTKDELKQAVKLIHETDRNSDNENPVDKAIKVLFDKHQQQDSNDNIQPDADNDEISSYLHNDNSDLNSDTDFV